MSREWMIWFKDGTAILLRSNFLKLLFLTVMLGQAATVFAAPSTALQPIPEPQMQGPVKIDLGKRLFEEPMLSKNLSTSCSSCHQLKNAGVDNLPRYLTMDKKPGAVNTPSIFNSSLNFRQFWDGRAKTIADVVNDHVSDKTIFDNNWPSIVEKIGKNTLYDNDFKIAYPEGVTQETINDALKSYIDNLLTSKSKFDLYLKGDKTALTNDQLKGYRLFRKYGCATCHQGPNIGGNLYQRMGVYKNYFADKGTIEKADLGLFNVTGKEEDKFYFKVPSLRNISLTGPYLHDGSVKTLPEMIQIMGVYQVGQPIRTEEADSIAQFLQSLNAKPLERLVNTSEE